MSVKELLVDSWSNMLKNNFILKTILVTLATILVYIAFAIVVGIGLAIHWALGLILSIAAIIIGYPMMMATTKVLLDTFQGREAHVFGFVGYGYKNIKRMWAVLGRTILKMLVLYILIIVLTLGLCGYIVYNVYTMYNSIVAGTTNTLHSSYQYNLEDLQKEIESLDLDAIEEDAEDLDISGLEEDFEDIDWSEYGIDSDQFNGLIATNPNATTTPSFDWADFWEAFGPQILKHLAVIGLFFIAYIVVYILFVMKSLYYTFAYMCAFEDDNLTALQAVEQSEDLMQGHRGKYFWVSVLIGLIYQIIISLIVKLDNAALVFILDLALMIIYVPYVISYSFTFFNKIRGVSAPSTVATTVDTVSADEVSAVVDTPAEPETPAEDPVKTNEPEE